MNRTYRLVWSQRHHQFVAASELASSCGSRGESRPAARAAAGLPRRIGRFFALAKLAGAACLALGLAVPAGAAPVLVSEAPWGSTNDQSAMNAAYGAGNWTFYNSYANAAPNTGSIFSNTTNFVYLQGSAGTDVNLKSFLGTHESTILDWVSHGGNLLLESAGWTTSIKFGGAALNHGTGYESSTGSLTAIGEKLFTSTPIANTSRNGGSLAHDTITADDGVNLLTFIEGTTGSYGVQPIVAGYKYGQGYLLYSGLTLYQFHSATDGSALGSDAPSWLLNMIEGFKSPGQIGEASGDKPSEITPGTEHVASALAANKLSPVFDGGTLKMDVPLAIYTQDFTLKTGGGTIDQNGNDSTFVGVIRDGETGGGPLTITNGATGGAITLAGTNTYSGGTVVNGGATVRVSSDANLGTGKLTLDGGTLQTTASFATSRTMVLGSGGGAFHTNRGTTLVLGGALSGDGVLVKSGAGTLELAGDNAGGPEHKPGTGWTGGLLINDGKVEVTNPWGLGWGNVVLNGGTINTTVNILTGQAMAFGGGASIDTAAGTTTTMSGVVVTSATGSGCFVKTGQGTLNVAGSATLSKGTCVQQGALLANGLLESDVTVAAGARLGGAGVIHGAVDVQGTLSPGNSPGYLTVTGDVNMLSGSTYREDIAGTLQAGPTTPIGAAGYYSHLHVANGSRFNIAANSTLAPQLQNLFTPGEAGYGSAAYVPRLGDNFRIVTAEGGINGRFDSVAQPDGMAGNTRFAVFYNTFGNHSIDLKVVPTSYQQSLVASNGNARAAAAVLDRIVAAEDAGNATTAQDQLLYVAASQNEARLSPFVQALAGEVHGAMAAAAPQAGQRLASTVVRQMDGMAATQPGKPGEAVQPKQALWVDIGVDRGRWNGSGSGSSFHANRSQFVLGADMLDSDKARAGIGFSYSNSHIGANAGSGKIDEFMGFAYGQAALGPVVLDGIAGYGTNDWHTQRADVTGLSSSALKTDASGHSTQFGMGVRTPLSVGRTVLEPFARVLWQKSTRGAADEGGATPAGLALAEYSATGTRVTMGLTAGSAKDEASSGRLRYQFSAGVGRDNGDLMQPTVNASLAGIGMPITSPDVGRVFGQASFNGTMALTKQAYAYLGLNGEVRRGRHDVGINGGMRVSF